MHINGASVLKVIRDGIATDLLSIASFFDPNGYDRHTKYDVSSILTALSDAGLVTLLKNPTGAATGGAIDNVSAEINPRWQAIQRSLGLSLGKLAEKKPDSVEVTPLFGTPGEMPTPPDIFVLMPFDPKLLPIYNDHILSVGRSMNLVTLRADDFFNANHVMADVWRAIWYSKVVIADCTNRNPNVFL